jgi:transposase, IS5 family
MFSPAAARRVREIASKLRSRGKLAQEEATGAIARLTGELADVAEKTAAQAADLRVMRPDGPA